MLEVRVMVRVRVRVRVRFRVREATQDRQSHTARHMQSRSKHNDDKQTAPSRVRNYNDSYKK